MSERVIPQVFVFEVTDPPEEYRIHLKAVPTFVFHDEHPHKALANLNKLHHSCCDVVQDGVNGATPLRAQRVVCSDLPKLRAWLAENRGATGTWYTDCGACRPADAQHLDEKPTKEFALDR